MKQMDKEGERQTAERRKTQMDIVTSVRTFIVLCVWCVRFFPVLSVSLTFTFLGCC